MGMEKRRACTSRLKYSSDGHAACVTDATSIASGGLVTKSWRLPRSLPPVHHGSPVLEIVLAMLR